MTRVVVHADDGLADRLAASLGRRGLTVRRAADSGGAEAVVRGRDVDVVIETCGIDCSDPARCPYRQYAATEWVMVLVGCPPADCALRGLCRTILTEPATDPEELSEAVAASCREEPAGLDPASALGAGDDYAQYLNHELRTPLTAVQSALEILALAMPVTEGPDLVRLLEIARSNLSRLGRSVAWSEEWHYLRTRGIPHERTLWSLDELADAGGDDVVGRAVTWRLAGDTTTRLVTANRAGIGLLVRQIERALVFYAPTAEFELHAAVEPVAVGQPDLIQRARLGLIWLPIGDPAAAPQVGQVVRTQLVRPGQIPGDELARLLALTVIADLVAELDARIELTEQWEILRPVVSVQLPVALAAAEPSVAVVS